MFPILSYKLSKLMDYQENNDFLILFFSSVKWEILIGGFLNCSGGVNKNWNKYLSYLLDCPHSINPGICSFTFTAWHKWIWST